MLSLLIPWFGNAKLIAAAVAGGAIAAVVMTAYTATFTIPAAKREAAKIAQAEMLQKFKDMSNELASDAEKFRINRIACRAVNGVFDFSTGDCRKG